MEQDYLEYIVKSSLLTQSPDEADWHYLPVFWTRWHLNHDYAKSGVDELQSEVSRVLIEPKKTFTICQYDDGPLINLGSAVVFLSSRKTSAGKDIPLLRNVLKLPFIKPRKRYLASFVGRLGTDPVRKEMANILSRNKDVFIEDGDKGQKFFVTRTLQSYTALCPRGYGGSSFRFFEAMQLGVVPLLIGDIDTRPFKKFIDWDEISLYVDNPDKLSSVLNRLNRKQLQTMGSKARAVYLEHLEYGKWPAYVIKELGLIK